MTFEELKTAFDLTEKEIALFKRFFALLSEWNERMDLTAITSKEAVVEKHFYDSLLALRSQLFIDGSSVLDIGSGAGFPGIPLAIVKPECRFFLLDSSKKRCSFLEEAQKALGLGNVNVINGRAEDLKEKETFDVVTGRAVTNLPAFLELAAPLAKVNGAILAMRGQKGADEVMSAQKAIKTLRLETERELAERLPQDNGQRLNVVIRKKGKTPDKFPRSWAEILHKPL